MTNAEKYKEVFGFPPDLDTCPTGIKKQKHSEEYERGYRCGYQTAVNKGKDRKKSSLVDISLIPKHGNWYHIEGDDNTFVCPFCETHTETEGDYYPKFCMECGAKLNVIKESEDK